MKKESITLFGVECEYEDLCYKSHETWQGQMKDYPFMDVYIRHIFKSSYFDEQWFVRITWFGGGFNRVFLEGCEESLEGAVKKVSKEFEFMMKGAKAIQGRIL